MAIINPAFGSQITDSKVGMAMAMLEQTHPELTISVGTWYPAGDFIEFNMTYQGKHYKHRIANTYLASASPSDIYSKLEADLGFKWDKKTDEPVGKSRVKSVDPVEDWADNWVKEKGDK